MQRQSFFPFARKVERRWLSTYRDYPNLATWSTQALHDALHRAIDYVDYCHLADNNRAITAILVYRKQSDL